MQELVENDQVRRSAWSMQQETIDVEKKENLGGMQVGLLIISTIEKWNEKHA